MCETMPEMNKPKDSNMKTETKSEGVRLPLESWTQLRALMAYYGGRAWLVRVIGREWRKIQGKVL